MTVDAQQFPVTTIGGIIVMVVIAMMNGQFPQAFPVEFARATTTNPGIHFKRPGTVTLFSLLPGSVSLRDNAIKFIFRTFH
jgi:hypothetical protein